MSFKDFNENHSNPYGQYTNVRIIFSFANKFQNFHIFYLLPAGSAGFTYCRAFRNLAFQENNLYFYRKKNCDT